MLPAVFVVRTHKRSSTIRILMYVKRAMMGSQWANRIIKDKVLRGYGNSDGGFQMSGRLFWIIKNTLLSLDAILSL